MTPELSGKFSTLPREPEADTEIFAIGDIHGRAGSARRAHAAAEGEESAQAPRLVFLGDLVDRGPDNLGAIGLAIEARRVPRRRGESTI